jgi:hypothetical protein
MQKNASGVGVGLSSIADCCDWSKPQRHLIHHLRKKERNEIRTGGLVIEGQRISDTLLEDGCTPSELFMHHTQHLFLAAGRKA